MEISKEELNKIGLIIEKYTNVRANLRSKEKQISELAKQIETDSKELEKIRNDEVSMIDEISKRECVTKDEVYIEIKKIYFT